MRHFLASLAMLLSTLAQAGYDEHPRTAELLKKLADDYHFAPDELDWVRGELRQAQRLPKLIESEQQAKEKTLTWAAYRQIHINPANIENGRAFLREYRKSLARAEAQYGVPKEVIAAILGVETKYGRYHSSTRVIDALATQGFDHPTRSDFFFGELIEFFVLCRDLDFDPQLLRGSYAGALGAAQFMPSNYRRLAVDFNNDGRKDLWNLSDAIGSIARYLTEYDPQRAWQRNQPIVAPAKFEGEFPGPEINGRAADSTVAALEKAGVRIPAGLPADMPAGLLQLPGDSISEWWVALPNFYAIKTYNPRVFYAMSVTELAHELEVPAATATDGGTENQGSTPDSP